ncbi:MAG: prepilin-type N-terminal cleavage/methylation domain-containing protein [Thermodesulfovibrionales bacterium]|nr:prepilin-type N-terminal cleavage/methylation domain-containing protein [Thermodesulfovibrionales bacterium]
MLRNKGGFTLIELVMIIVILGILAAVAIPKYQDLKTDAENAADAGVLGAVRSSTGIYFGKYKTWPTQYGQLFDTLPTEWTTDGTDKVMTCPTAHTSPQVTLTLSGGGASVTTVTKSGSH